MPEKKGISKVDITVGADPELVVVATLPGQTESPVYVSDIIPTSGEFGADGHGYIAELRPKAAPTPQDLVDNIRHSLATGYSALSEYAWRGGPYILEKPCGGHIHFGGVSLTGNIIESLGNIGAIAVAIIEPEVEARLRRTQPLRMARGSGFNNGGNPYGAPTDIREKPYGFEWRTPSSFVVTPSSALSLIAIGKALVFEEEISGPNCLNRMPKNLRAALVNSFTRNEFSNCNKSTFNPMLPSLVKHLRSLAYFKRGMEGASLWSTVLGSLTRAQKANGYRLFKDIKSRWQIHELAEKVRQVTSLSRRRGVELGPNAGLILSDEVVHRVEQAYANYWSTTSASFIITGSTGTASNTTVNLTYSVEHAWDNLV